MSLATLEGTTESVFPVLTRKSTINGYSILDFMCLLCIDLRFCFGHDTFVMSLGEMTPDLWPASGGQGEGLRGGVRIRQSKPQAGAGPLRPRVVTGGAVSSRWGSSCQRKAVFGRPRVLNQGQATSGHRHRSGAEALQGQSQQG